MDRHSSVRGRIAFAWIGIVLGAAGAAGLEADLLEARVALAVAGTTLLAIAAGTLLTRRMLAKARQPLITVQDLRRR
jgi:uncharacterized membrane protein YgdD (TMEM256/DUF423 family)